ncbi:MAG: uridine kinase [Gemmatimonadetes bacterium GWC2_71_10]|nr:MAG: uridine kinase [Gemmatimonadetes bacterium GWC2_71_10]
MPGPAAPRPAIRAPRPLCIGVAGGSGSGKTTVTRAIIEAAGPGAVLIDMDAYYKDLAHLPLEERKRVNYDHPDALDLDLMVAQLEELVQGRPIDKPTYDYAAHTRAARTMRIEPGETIVVEGILLFADARLRALFDIKIFVDVADDVRFIRRLQRDTQERGRSMESVVAQYLGTVRPMHLEFVEPSKRYADVILPEGGQNRIGVEMILARVERETRLRAPGRPAAAAGPLSPLVPNP